MNPFAVPEVAKVETVGGGTGPGQSEVDPHPKPLVVEFETGGAGVVHAAEKERLELISAPAGIVGPGMPHSGGLLGLMIQRKCPVSSFETRTIAEMSGYYEVRG